MSECLPMFFVKRKFQIPWSIQKLTDEWGWLANGLILPNDETFNVVHMTIIRLSIPYGVCMSRMDGLCISPLPVTFCIGQCSAVVRQNGQEQLMVGDHLHCHVIGVISWFLNALLYFLLCWNYHNIWKGHFKYNFDHLIYHWCLHHKYLTEDNLNDINIAVPCIRQCYMFVK